MKRKEKNIICTLIILILLCSIGLTIYLAKNNLSTTSNQNVMNDNNQMGTIGQDGNGQGNTGNGSSETPPEKPDGENNSGNSETSTPPEKPDGENSTGNGETSTPPEKPDGENNNSNGETSTPPEMSNGNTNSGENNGTQMQTNMNNQSSISLTITYYIAFGIETLLLGLVIVYLIQSKFNMIGFKEVYASSDKVIINILSSIIICGVLTFGISYLTNNVILSGNTNSENNVPGGMNNNGSSSASYSSASEITESTTISDKTYTSSSEDENALSVSGDVEVTASDISVSKTGDSDGGDNTSFYGTNSAIIAKDGATLNLENINVTTDATGANGVFSYGGSATTNNSSSDGTTINISNSTITTSKDNSGGIMTTGGGTTNASNLTVTTAGTSSAAIRSDRGGGEVNVDGGTYKTTGNGSPAIYSTAEISVKNAELISTASEGIVIEGKNSVSIENVKLTDSNTKLNGQSTTYKNIFLYQSMSGDADDGLSEFSATDSTITTNNGDTFYITNTTCEINLNNNKITNNDSDGNFLRAKSDSWGNSGSNGGIVTLNMNNQTANGNIVIDSVSTLDMTLKSSSYVGTINKDNEAKSIKITLDKSSTIKLTGNSYITSLDNEDTSNSNIDFNGYTLYVNGKAIN